MFFQVAWLRCHIVRIQGKKERRNPVKSEWFPANPSPILPTFCHGTKVKPWKFEKKIPRLSFVWRERGTKEETSCFAKNSQKVTKSAKKIGTRCSSQKPSNFIARDERPRESERFEPQQGILWQIWPKSPKKCQMRKFPEKEIFQSSKKGLKRWKKWF